MRMILWAVLIAAIAAFALLWTFIEGKVYAKREKDNDRIILEVKALFGLIRYRKDVPLVTFANWCKGIVVKVEEINDKTDDLQSAGKQSIGRRKVRRYMRSMRLLLKKTWGFNDWFRQLFARIECTNLSWNTRIGLMDAPTTAFIVGVIWAIKSTIVGFGHRYFKMKRLPNISVVPQYNVLDFSTEFLVTGKIRSVYILIAGFRLIVRISREKAGFAAWRRVLASNRKG